MPEVAVSDREVIEQRSGDGDDKVTLLMALLRASGIPSRIRYMEMKGVMLRGLVPSADPPDAARPLAEIRAGTAAGAFTRRQSCCGTAAPTLSWAACRPRPTRCSSGRCAW
jgi:transglutaminase-like putative cysteine protease